MNVMLVLQSKKAVSDVLEGVASNNCQRLEDATTYEQKIFILF